MYSSNKQPSASVLNLNPFREELGAVFSDLYQISSLWLREEEAGWAKLEGADCIKTWRARFYWLPQKPAIVGGCVLWHEGRWAEGRVIATAPSQRAWGRPKSRGLWSRRGDVWVFALTAGMQSRDSDLRRFKILFPSYWTKTTIIEDSVYHLN